MHKISENIFMMRTNERVCSTVYVLEHEGKRLIIDAGDGVAKLDFAPEVCILTHGHYDHAKGAGPEWKSVFLHPADFSKKPFIFVPPNARQLDFSMLKFGSFELEIIHTPGHTAGSICILERKSGLLFSGDTKFSGGCGRTDLGGSEERMQKSLATLDSLEWSLLCPGHGMLEWRKGGKLI